jgi:hypothetical protein
LKHADYYATLTRVSKKSHEIGYEDIQSFSRFFKKIEGVSPSDFKKQYNLLFLGANPAIRFIFYAEPQHKRMSLLSGLSDSRLLSI